MPGVSYDTGFASVESLLPLYSATSTGSFGAVFLAFFLLRIVSYTIATMKSTKTITATTAIAMHSLPSHIGDVSGDNVQVNICKKLLLLYQLTHNMTTDCS